MVTHTKRQNELFLRFCKLFFLSSPSLPWQPGTRLVHQWSSEKTVTKPHPTVHFVSWYIARESKGPLPSCFGPFDLFVHRGGTYGIEFLNQVKYISIMVSI